MKIYQIWIKYTKNPDFFFKNKHIKKLRIFTSPPQKPQDSTTSSSSLTPPSSTTSRSSSSKPSTPNSFSLPNPLSPTTLTLALATQTSSASMPSLTSASLLRTSPQSNRSRWTKAISHDLLSRWLISSRPRPSSTSVRFTGLRSSPPSNWASSWSQPWFGSSSRSRKSWKARPCFTILSSGSPAQFSFTSLAFSLDLGLEKEMVGVGFNWVCWDLGSWVFFFFFGYLIWNIGWLMVVLGGLVVIFVKVCGWLVVFSDWACGLLMVVSEWICRRLVGVSEWVCGWLLRLFFFPI